MASWDEGIEGPHLEIARSEAQRIGVLAGPGTGKTSFGLMRRVARLLSAGVDGKRILLISFTRVAAADLRDKVAALEGDSASEVRATTLHSYCLGLLQRDAVLTITQRTPRILLAHEADLMLRDIGGNYGNIYERRDRLRAFEAGWARAIDDHPGLASLPEDRAFEAAVLSWLREHRCILIGEVVPIAFDYLRHNPLAPELAAFDHIIVDEYQDLNTLEQQLLEILAARESVSICTAGDDDQSIYRMRYANPAGILAFLASAGTEPYEIHTCGRCPQHILAMANSLIGAAPDRDKPALEGNHSENGSVAIVQWPDLDEEISGIIAAIAADLAAERREPGQILVLTHRRFIGDRLRQGLTDLGIAARSYFTEEELGSDAAQEALALLRLAVALEDAPALRTVVGAYESTGRSAAYQRLRTFAKQEGLTTRDVLSRLAEGERLNVSVRALVERYKTAIARIDQLDMDDLDALVEGLFPEDIADLSGLRRAALEARIESTSASELLTSIVAAVTQEDVPQHPDFVRIMSLHKSKGLTADSVFVVGMIEGIVPTITPRLTPAEVDAAVAEQRRLFYVAVTRAADQLTISLAQRMDLATARALNVAVASNTVRRGPGGALTCGTIASRYLRELGPVAPGAVSGQRWIETY